MIYMPLLTWIGFGLIGYVPNTLCINNIDILLNGLTLERFGWKSVTSNKLLQRINKCVVECCSCIKWTEYLCAGDEVPSRVRTRHSSVVQRCGLRLPRRGHLVDGQQQLAGLISRRPSQLYYLTHKHLMLTELLSYIHTYHSRFIPEGVAEVSQIFLRDTHLLPKLVNYEEHCRRDRW
jgi:hypothetical protein